MSDWINRNFDIDLWLKLAAQDPYKFELQRKQWLEDTIEEAKPEQKPRLQGLLWEMHMDLQIAKNKYNNCKLVATRVVNHLKDFKEVLAGQMPYINQHPAIIVPFSSKGHQTTTQ